MNNAASAFYPLDICVQKLKNFVESRPGFCLGNYSTRADYERDARRARRAREDFYILLRAFYRRHLDAFNESEIIAARAALFGRLSSRSRLSWDPEKMTLDYCTGQYFPTEYRAAAAAAVAGALWDLKRDEKRPDGSPVYTDGDDMRRAFRRIFGARIQKEYFS